MKSHHYHTGIGKFISKYRHFALDSLLLDAINKFHKRKVCEYSTNNYKWAYSDYEFTETIEITSTRKESIANMTLRRLIYYIY